MKNGNFWTVVFVTGEYGNRYMTKKEAIQYAQNCNRYSESKGTGTIASRVEQYKRWEKVKEEIIYSFHGIY